MNFLTKYKILNKYQFGFRRGHSTSMTLIEVMDEIYENIDKQNYVMGIFLDLQFRLLTLSLIPYFWTSYLHMELEVQHMNGLKIISVIGSNLSLLMESALKLKRLNLVSLKDQY